MSQIEFFHLERDLSLNSSNHNYIFKAATSKIQSEFSEIFL